jgi:hypothetical protein
MEEHNGVPPHKCSEVTSLSTKELPQQCFNLGVSMSLPPLSPDMTTNSIFYTRFSKK